MSALLKPDFWRTATPEAVRTAVMHGANVNACHPEWGWQPIHVAAAHSPDPEAITALVQLGADPTAKARDGKEKPLHFAAAFNAHFEEIVRVLVRLEAELSA